MSFKEINPKELELNPFKSIGDKWMLITAGNMDKFNTMTASWGSLGVMWGKNVASVVIRPQRYTKEFIDKEDTFTISFFEDEYKQALTFCGSNSGRDTDKCKSTGLVPVSLDGGVAFEQAKLVLVCKKIYTSEMNPESILDKDIEKWYPNKDYHCLYVGEIVKAYVT